MFIANLIRRYTHLSVFTKIMIPQVVALIVGIGYMFYTSSNITMISQSYNTVKERMIPALEMSETNLLLLKQIANDFTFATLSSEEDFLDSPKSYNAKIIQNLQQISNLTKIDTQTALRDYRAYFQYTYALTQRMIDQQSQYSEEMDKVLLLYQKTHQHFVALNQQVKEAIEQKTNAVSNALHAFHTDVLLFGLILYIIVTLITFLIYKGLQKSFFKLISDIATLRQSGMIKEKLAQFSKNEFGLLAKELNAVFSEFNEAYQNLENIANKDKLTQLYNRVYMDKKIKEFEKQQEPVGIILADIDHFKSINDTYGHAIGDEVLQNFAKVLKEALPSHAIVSRWGGEEFLILLPTCQEPYKLQAYAESARVAVSSKHFKKVGSVTASFGCSYHIPPQKFDESLEHADTALYRAKASGRNCTRLHNV